MSFQGKVVIVTGGGSGIGAVIAEKFVKEGANVVLVERNEDKLNKVADKCSKIGKRPLIIRADLSIDEEVRPIVDKTVKEFGKLDVLVNNAGLVKDGSLLNGNALQAYDESMATNIRGVVHLTSLATPELVKTKGNIVNISSITSLCVVQDTSLTFYSVSKAALDQFTKCAALELSEFGVRANVINPGPVRTNILSSRKLTPEQEEEIYARYKKYTALKQLIEREEIADLTLFLASDKAKSITGSTHVIDNGHLLKN